jgi:hypothetical protein
MLFVAEHFFTKKLDAVTKTVEDSLSKSGMAAEQVNAIALAIYSIESNVSWFVLCVGLAVIQLNLVLLLSPDNSRSEK